MPLVGLALAGARVSAREIAVLTARDAGLVGCRRCARVWPGGTATCGRCGAALMSRDPLSLSRVWAWWVAGVLAYVPANLWPMLQTTTLLQTQEDTIVSGAVELATSGAPGVAAIILVASVLIPIAKFLAIAVLALTVGRPTRLSATARTRMYEVVEYIGRWSMIDVFVVAILSSLVQLEVVASINPGPAALAFAASVICTMLSAQAFDPRMIWDGIEGAARRPDPVPAEAAPAEAAPARNAAV